MHMAAMMKVGAKAVVPFHAKIKLF